MRTFNLLASLFLLCLLTAFSAAYAQEPAQGGQALDQAANDPTASLMNVQIQNVYTGDYHNLKGESGNAILLRSAVPFKTGPLNHIARATLPIVTKSPSGESGLSDLVSKTAATSLRTWGAMPCASTAATRPATSSRPGMRSPSGKPASSIRPARSRRRDPTPLPKRSSSPTPPTPPPKGAWCAPLHRVWR